MMAMLIRAGLPSRRAAMAAILNGDALFVSPAEMQKWLGSNEITAFTDQGNWPTAETAALWCHFRADNLAGGTQAWTIASWARLFDVPDGSPHPPAGLYRIESDEQGTTWLSTADYQRLAPFRKAIRDLKPSLLMAWVAEPPSLAEVTRVGRGKAVWPPAKPR
jgi:hypothetical protein